MKANTTKLLSLFFAALSSGSTLAAVSTDEARQLDSDKFTAFGAERAGNKDGSIPAWTGERVKAPAEYDAQDSLRLPDPFKDKPLFSITAQNMAKYADRLTESQKELFKRFPDFRMDVYPTRRTVTYPKWALDFTKQNATSCKAENNGLKLVGCWGGVAFPFPKNGNEVMWNHITRYSVPALHGVNTQWLVDNSGTIVQTGGNVYDSVYPFHEAKRAQAARPEEVYFKLRFDVFTPARKVGEKYVILWSLSNVTRAYQYLPGQRRVKLAPDLAYDTPAPGNGGIVTMDEAQLFLGAMDRYDFKLVGKQEKYIPYNSYKLQDYKACPNASFLNKNFPNPDCQRWELHRVWVVEAKLKPGFRHVLPARTFYLDEDGYGGGATDEYDAAGKLYRAAFSYPFQFYNSQVPGNYSDCTVHYDFQVNKYAAMCLHGEKGHGIAESAPKPDLFFSPEAMAGEGVR